jgi:cytochrome P450
VAHARQAETSLGRPNGTGVRAAPRSAPPGPWGLDVLGFFGDGTFEGTLRFLREQSERYGPVVSFGSPLRRLYLLNDPELLRQVLVVQQHRFARSTGAALLREILGESLVTSEEPLHRERRRMMQPAFHRKRLAAYASDAASEARRAREGLRDGQLLDIGAAMTRLTLAITGRAFFGTEVCNEAEALGASLARALETVSRLGPVLEALPPALGRAWRRLPLPSRLEFARARRDLATILQGAIARRRGSGGATDDLLSLVLEARDDAGVAFDDRAVVDELSTLLFAGHETTANALTWAWYLLAAHPDEASRLHAEVDALGEREPTYDDLADLPVTQSVFAETLRLYPPASAFGRLVLEPCDLGGYTLAPGSGVVISPYVSHRNPRFFPEPERFVPARWHSENWPEFAYVPFGGGARRCIGEAFARMEGVLVLATLARRYRFERIERGPIGIGSATLRPVRPIVVRARARESA